MELPRSPIRQGRRRRVRPEDPAAAPVRRTRRRNVRHETRYALAEQPENQRLLTDFVPVSCWVLMLWYGIGIAVCAGLVGLHFQRDALERIAGLELGLVQLGVPANIGAWVSCLVLSVTAAWGLLIFELRRHRMDDYGGRYRIWLWLSLILLVTSLDAVTWLHAIVGQLLAKSLPSTTLPAEQLGGIGMYGPAFILLGMQLTREIWESKLARVSLLVTACVYLLASLPLRQGLPAEWLARTDVHIGLLMLPLCGHWGLLFTTAAYGRHVRLDVEGKLQAVSREKPAAGNAEAERETLAQETASSHVTDSPGTRRKSDDDAADNQTDETASSAGWLRLPGWKRNTQPEAQPVAAKSTRKRAAAKPITVSNATTENDCPADDPGATDPAYQDDQTIPMRMSKAERKKLRRQKRKLKTAA